MRTIKYRFIPLNERSDDELSALYRAIHIGYFDVNTDEDRRQLLGVLAEKTEKIKRFEICDSVVARLLRTNQTVASVDCGNIGKLLLWLQNGKWCHMWVDKSDFDYQVEVVE